MSNRATGVNLLFVYGTLMKGLGMDWQRKVGAHFVGLGRMTGKLYDLGDYPGAVFSSNPLHQIEGEVYRLDDPDAGIGILDQYEEFLPSRPDKSLFIRKKLPVKMKGGVQKRAWVYLFNRAVKEADLIPGGSYRERLSAGR
jgi:pyruvate carboxylase